MANDPSQNDKAFARRDFFRRFLLKGLDSAEDAGKKMAGQISEAFATAGQAAQPSENSAAPAPSFKFLRPPGALPELQLAETCSRCGDCVRACPATAIRLEPARAGGLPFIIPREQPCVICTDLSCMNVCPTGALKLLKASDIAMGIAMVDHDRCLRGPFDPEPAPDTSARRGEDCKLCVTSCPVGEKAISIDVTGKVAVGQACVGCGVCERACPTEMASIMVSAE